MHASAKSKLHVRPHRMVRVRLTQRRVRFHGARVVGPSYYPGLGEFYPPYANPCHFKLVFNGIYGAHRTYTCSW
jgi:hypothetical protein